MKKSLFSWLLLSVLSLAVQVQAFAQNLDFEHACTTDEVQKALFAERPDIAEEAREYNRQLEEAVRNFNPADYAHRDGEPFIVSVVFHVIHNNGPENISNAQIEDCIRVMNEDFSASNAGAALVNSAFADIVADVGIEFRLARLDPEGNCTNGIVRTVSPLTSQGGENLKQISPIWDRSKYLNVWVCATIASGAAGYAYYPGSVAGNFGLTNDGIVVRSNYVGSIGTSTLNRSHVLTHEVGHWINLAHLWGSTNQPGVEDNCNTDDGVEDTPNTIGWTSCSINGQSCGSLDNVENFMEYAYCMRMFTEGQKQRLLASLTSGIAQRSNLWQEQTLIDTGVLLDSEPCKAVFVADRTDICVGESVQFVDESYNNIEERTWIFQGGSPALSFEANPSVSFSQPGAYTVSLAVSGANATLTNVQTNFIQVLSESEMPVPYTEDFESFEAGPLPVLSHWFVNPMMQGPGWRIADFAGYSGSKSMYIAANESPQNSRHQIRSRTFEASHIEGPAVLTFKYAHARRVAPHSDILRIYVKRSCSNMWNLRQTISGSSLPTVSAAWNAEFIPESQEDWREVVVDNIPELLLTDEFRVMFEFVSAGGNNIYIDDINLHAAEVLSTEPDDKTSVFDFKAYPNPARNQLFVDWSSQSNEGMVEIAIYDLSGRKVDQVYSGYSGSGDQRVNRDISSLAAGVYIVEWRGEQSGRMTQTLVIAAP